MLLQSLLEESAIEAAIVAAVPVAVHQLQHVDGLSKKLGVDDRHGHVSIRRKPRILGGDLLRPVFDLIHRRVEQSPLVHVEPSASPRVPMIRVAHAFEGELRDDAEAPRSTAERAPEQTAPVLGGWATNGAQRSVGSVDLELDDVVKRQPVAPDQVAIPSGLCVSADSDVGTLSVRDGDPVSLELGGDVRQQHAGIDPGHGLAARSLDLQMLEALHAEQNRVFATRGEPAVLMTAAASHEVLLVGFGKPDRSGGVIAVPSRNSDQIWTHSLGVRGGRVLHALLVITGCARQEYVPAESRNRPDGGGGRASSGRGVHG